MFYAVLWLLRFVCLNFSVNPTVPAGCTHFCAAIKIAGFIPPEEFKKGMDRLIQVYHGLPKAKGVTRITIPGEFEWALEAERRENGIPLDEEVIQSLKELSKEFNVEYDLI